MDMSNSPECKIGKMTSLARKCHHLNLEESIGMISISK